VFVFVFALLASIALHELGHLVTAKRYGMKASRYFIGMGPTVWSTRRGETEYGVKALPIGGFVKIEGMTMLDDIHEADEPRAFWRQPAKQRAVVLSAGSFMHFVVALVVMYGALVFFGEPTTDTTRVGALSECLESDPETGCQGKPKAPGLAAGIQVGDRVVAFDEREVADWKKDFTPLVQAHGAGPADLTVLRDGKRVTVRVDVASVPELDDNDQPTGRMIGRIGLYPGDTLDHGPLSALPRSGQLVWDVTKGSVTALVKLPGAIGKLFEDTVNEKKRTVTDGGPVGVVDIGRFSAQAFEHGDFLAVLSMIAALNVFVGLFNMLPLLPLDGGHLAILGYEGARAKVYRLLGRPVPGRVDLRRLMPAMVAFIVVMGSVTVMLLYAGIANPIADPFK